jgi:hypothetical protein
MIRASDLAPTMPRSLTSTSARSADASSDTAWFDDAVGRGDACISADLSPASRGLSVEQHAARVLAHLCGERK